MSALIYSTPEENVEVFTNKELEEIRNKLMVLSSCGFHPRYADPIDQMLNATVDILIQMDGDEKRCSHGSIDEA